MHDYYLLSTDPFNKVATTVVNTCNTLSMTIIKYLYTLLTYQLRQLESVPTS